MFTPAIFTEKFRRSIKAWGYHGFLPKRKSSSAQKQTLRMGDAIRIYHKELDAVLESFRHCSPQLCGVHLPIGPKGRICVDIVTCVLFIIQDMQEGDMLCGRYGVHTSGIQRPHRCCDVNCDDLKNCDVHCKNIVASDMGVIARSNDDDLRKRWSQHKLENAFEHISFADQQHGIFGATPVETMHAFRKGVIEKVTKLILDSLPASKKAAFDDLAIAFHKFHRQTHREEYPSTDFSNGVTNLTKISNRIRRRWTCFLFVILFQYDAGWKMIQSCLEKRTNKKVPEVLEVLESLLCFDAWLNQSYFWETTNPAHIAKEMKKHQDSIRNFMDMCKQSIPLKVEGKDEDKKKGKKKGTIIKKEEGQKSNAEDSWKFPKFHELLHIVDDMSWFVSPVNFCAQHPESLLIPAAKHPGRQAQK